MYIYKIILYSVALCLLTLALGAGCGSLISEEEEIQLDFDYISLGETGDMSIIKAVVPQENIGFYKKYRNINDDKTWKKHKSRIVKIKSVKFSGVARNGTGSRTNPEPASALLFLSDKDNLDYNNIEDQGIPFLRIDFASGEKEKTITNETISDLAKIEPLLKGGTFYIYAKGIPYKRVAIVVRNWYLKVRIKIRIL